MLSTFKKLNKGRTEKYLLALATLFLMARMLLVEWGKLDQGGLQSEQEMRKWRQSTETLSYCKSYCKGGKELKKRQQNVLQIVSLNPPTVFGN